MRYINLQDVPKFWNCGLVLSCSLKDRQRVEQFEVVGPVDEVEQYEGEGKNPARHLVHHVGAPVLALLVRTRTGHGSSGGERGRATHARGPRTTTPSCGGNAWLMVMVTTVRSDSRLSSGRIVPRKVGLVGWSCGRVVTVGQVHLKPELVCWKSVNSGSNFTWAPSFCDCAPKCA